MYLKRFIILFLLILAPAILSICQNVDSLNDTTILKDAKLSYNRGKLLGRTGKLDSALYYSENAVRLYENAIKTDSTRLAYSYQSLGIIKKLLGQYDEALELYNKAEKIHKLNNNIQLTGYIYVSKANIYAAQKNYSKALDYQLRANTIFKSDSVKFRDQLATTYNNLGNTYRRINDFENSINNYKKSLSLKTGNKSKYITIGNLALCYDKFEKNDLANSHYIEVIKKIKELNSKNNLKATKHYLNYAIFLAKQNNNEEALKFFQATIRIFNNNIGNKHPDLSNAYNSLGEYYFKLDNLDSALFYFQKSLIAISPNFDDKNISANPNTHDALSKTKLLSSFKNKANTLFAYYKQTNNEDYLKLSIETYDLAIESIDIIRSGYLSEESKLFLAANEFETFSNALQTCYEIYKLTNDTEYLNKAFSYSEGAKSAILSESLKNNQALNIGGIPDSLIIKEKNLRKSIWTFEELIYEENKKQKPDLNKLDYWNKYLFDEKQEFDKLSEYLEINFPNYQSLKNIKSSISINKIQKKLSRNKVLIEFFNTADKIYTIIIDKKHSEIYKQNIDTVYHNHLNDLLKSLSNNNFSYHGIKEFNNFQKSSFYIYQKLLMPYKSKIENKDLIIIPSGKLTYLPFEILITEKKHYNKINYNALPYLLHGNTFNYSYSASLLFENNTSSRNSRKKLGAFAPIYENANQISNNSYSLRQEYREQLYPLKGIKEEVKQISDLLDGDTYLDYNANEKKFKEVAAKYDILHLAMHTIMDDENPMYSKMAFSQNNDSIEDGFLNTYELYNMKLNSRMAVLSSCNSGSGKFQQGEGVMSLARGFIYAGCPSIVMTLWTVEDNSGVKLMTSYYKHLIKGKSKSKALQLSKIDFLENADQLKSHPYFWSGYIVIGNNSSLFIPYKKYLLFLGAFILVIAGLVAIRRNRKVI